MSGKSCVRLNRKWIQRVWYIASSNYYYFCRCTQCTQPSRLKYRLSTLIDSSVLSFFLFCISPPHLTSPHPSDEKSHIRQSSTVGDDFNFFCPHQLSERRIWNTWLPRKRQLYDKLEKGGPTPTYLLLYPYS